MKIKESRKIHFLWHSKNASAGNRTRAARVAGEHSTTEPPMLPTTFVKGKYKHSALIITVSL